MVEEIRGVALFAGAVLAVIGAAGVAVFLVVVVSGGARVRLRERRLRKEWWADVRRDRRRR